MLENIDSSERKIVRKKHLAESIVIVDGFPGCGKTLFGPILSSLDRVEVMQYIFEIEFICRLFSLKKIEKDAAVSLVKMLTDHKLYQVMMGRDTNFRYSDLSSVFNNPNPWRYFKRIFSEGDHSIPLKIKDSKPILSLVTHDLLGYSEPILEALRSRLIFIEVVRHPLYMVIQQTFNMERLFSGSEARDIQIYYDYKNHELPYFCVGWEDKYINSNNVEKAIYSIYYATKKSSSVRDSLKASNDTSTLMTIPFEKFVINPDSYLKKIKENIGTNFTNKTKKVLKNQNVPRLKVSEGIPLEVYKRCGWEPADDILSEREELDKRRDWVKEMGADQRSLSILDSLCVDYEKKYL